MVGQKPGGGHGLFQPGRLPAQVGPGKCWKGECVRVDTVSVSPLSRIELSSPFLQVGTQVSVLTLLLSPPLLHTIPTKREHWKGLESTQSSPLIVQVMKRPKPRGPEMLTRIMQTVRGKTRLFSWSHGAAQLPKLPGVGSRQFMFLSPQGTSRSVTRSPSQRTSRKT